MNSIDESLRLKTQIALRNYQSSQTALDYETCKRARNRCNSLLKILYNSEMKANYSNLFQKAMQLQKLQIQ